MHGDVLVRVEGVRKKYCRTLKESLWYGMSDLAAEVLGGGTAHDRLRAAEFWAVDGVSFELRRGESLGLIGPNGAGKTTLLKMLNGLIKPDAGRISIRGRVGALLALGAGFHLLLTGRENIFINGAVLGLTRKQIEQKLDEIIDFAGIGDFIDSPVQSYSSGMKVRLGFAVATALEPDVLLIDEVLAVGDAAFRSKCYNRIDRLRERSAVILVSHSMEHVGRVCTSGLVLHGGAVRFHGATEQAIGAYDACNSELPETFILPHWPVRSASVTCPPSVRYGDHLDIRVSLQTATDINVLPRVVIMDRLNQVVAEANYVFNRLAPARLDAGSCSIAISAGPLHLRGGDYLLHVNLHDERGTLLVGGYNCARVAVLGPTIGETGLQLGLQCTAEVHSG
jgi:ABC-type polysaccharide/polyol phosphate transport system ATPase subunit